MDRNKKKQNSKREKERKKERKKEKGNKLQNNEPPKMARLAGEDANEIHDIHVEGNSHVEMLRSIPKQPMIDAGIRCWVCPDDYTSETETFPGSRFRKRLFLSLSHRPACSENSGNSGNSGNSATIHDVPPWSRILACNMLAGSTPNIATLRDRASSGKADHLIKLIGRLFPTPPFHPGSIFGVDFCLDPDTIQSGPTNKSCRSQQENPARDLSRQRRFRSRHFKIPTIKPKKKRKRKRKKKKERNNWGM